MIFCSELIEGDSGSVVCIEDNHSKERYAIGILQGKRKTREQCGNEKKEEQEVYEAVVLCHALKEVEADYPHLVNNLKLFTKI